MSSYLNKRRSRRERGKAVGTLCFMGRFYCPERFKIALYRTAKGVPTGWVAFAPTEDEGEIAVDWVHEGTSGAVKVIPGPGEFTCEFSFGPVLAERPLMAVDPEWALDIPFRVEEGRLILDLTAGEYRLSVPYEQKIGRRRRAAWEEADEGDGDSVDP